MKEAIHFINTGENEIIGNWEAAVNERIPASGKTESLALRDHLPHLLEDISDILAQHDAPSDTPDEERYMEIIRNSKEHGRHRASTSLYTIDQILHEYIIFHRVLIEYLENRSALSPEVNFVLNFAIENSMLYSARAFNDALREMRQKLIGILAHDMRNPISAALFAVDLMKTVKDGEQQEKLRLRARKSLKRSMDLIEGLLDSVTVGAGEGMTLDFAEVNLLNTIIAVSEEASEVYSNEIELQHPGEEITGVFDDTMVRRMLENLVSNAVKYGDREKEVSLFVENHKESVTIKVHNWGDPIPEENQKQIFNFLSSTHSNGVRELKSWGMGLTLARAVAEAHGGQLELKSSESEGTVFSVSLGKHKNIPGKKRARLNFR